MSLNASKSISLWRSAHCFRTWFVDECTVNKMFGVMEGNLRLLTQNKPALNAFEYKIDTRIFLEDIPYYRYVSNKKSHRILGPYSVTATDIPDSFESVHTDGEQTIIYREPHPELGPWFNRRNVERIIDGTSITFSQMAGQFDFFPYRFHFEKAANWRIEIVPCHAICDIC